LGMRNDAWALRLDGASSWRQLNPLGRLPSPRAEQSCVFDSARDRMVLFAGARDDRHGLGDAWSLSLGSIPQWDSLIVSGPTPSVRMGHTAVFDPASDAMWVFGGQQEAEALGDLWRLDLATNSWNAVSPQNAGPRP